MSELTWKVGEVIAAFDSGGYAVFPSRTATKEEATAAARDIAAMAAMRKHGICPVQHKRNAGLPMVWGAIASTTAFYAAEDPADAILALASDLEGRGE